MRILLDTHYLLWAFIDTGKIGESLLAKLLSDENEVYYSQASLWEIAIKSSLGKLSLKGMTPEELYAEIDNSFLRCRAFENEELITSYKLPLEHKDPFDRILIWQSIRSGFFFVSVDENVTRYKKYGLKTLS